jgi:hypothetical protein
MIVERKDDTAAKAGLDQAARRRTTVARGVSPGSQRTEESPEEAEETQEPDLCNR